MLELIKEEEAITALKGSVPEKSVLLNAKRDGFSDRYLSKLLEVPEEDIRAKRAEYGINEAWEGVHVSGTENAAYYYSTYNLTRIKVPLITISQKL